MFKGTSNKIVEEKLEKGIDGVTAVSDIPEGYTLEMENVDLSQPGVVRKRAGYNLWGCQLPVRTKQVRHVSNETIQCTLDVLPIISCNLSIYLNTAENSTATIDSYFKRTSDIADTVFVVMAPCGEVITDNTIFEITDTLGQKRHAQPVEVFDNGADGSSAKFLLPFFVKSWFKGVPIDVLTDITAIEVSAKVCDGYAFPRMRESDITRLAITSASGRYVVRIEFSQGGAMSELPLGTIVFFETRFASSTGVCGYVTEVSEEYVEIETQIFALGLQELDTHYFSMRYATGKCLWYKSRANSFSSSAGRLHPDPSTFRLRVTGCCEVTFEDSLVTNAQLSGGVSSSETAAVKGNLGAYYASWQADPLGANYQPADLPFERLTRVFYAFAVPSSDGTSLAYSVPSYALTQIPELIAQRDARNLSCKILISLGGEGGCNDLVAIAESDTKRASLVSTLVTEVVAKGVDGIDIDWEGTPRTPKAELFFAELRAALNNAGHYELTMAASMNLPYASVEVEKVHQYCDFINIMAYDNARLGAGITMPNASLGNVGTDVDNTGYYGIEYYIENQWKNTNIPLSKCGLGFPLYGYRWNSVTAGGVYGWLQSGTAVAGQPLYKDIYALLASGYTRYYDAQSKSYWLFNGSTFYTFDDVDTCTLKCDYIKAQGLGGMFFWEMAGDFIVSSSNSITKKASELLLTTGTVTTTTVQEVGYLYGSDVDIGYIGLLNKYFDVDTQQDRVLCGYDGSVFVEDSHLTTQITTIRSLQFGSTTQNIAANKAADTFTIPLPNANSVYKVGDLITITYATDTAGTLVTSQWVISSVSASSIVVAANGELFLLIPAYTRFVITRTSDKVYLSSPVTPLTKGMTVQYGVRNTQNPWYVIKEVDLQNTETTSFIVIDREITWSSDVDLTVLPIFLPVYPAGSVFRTIDYAFRPRERRDYSSVTLERNVIIASGLSGIWRFNGENLINMRIPTPPPGYIRNVVGSGGTLRIDETDGGEKFGRYYRFFVTYSYMELVNGKLIRYESPLNTVGCYGIYAEPAVDGSDTSQLIELQIPTIPDGIGLPAVDMTINVYRTKDGAASDIETDGGIYLKEIEADNNPDVPFISVLAGVAPRFSFTESQYDLLPVSFGGDKTADETQRRAVDVPLASLLTTLENRVVAANGADQPYVNLVNTGTVFSTVDSSFTAHAAFALVPPSSSETTYKFITCPVDSSIIHGANGAGTLPFDVFSVASATVKSVVITDTSHLFSMSPAPTLTDGRKYLLRYATGTKEAKYPGTANSPYYDGFGFEEQVFVWRTATSKFVSTKKWTSKLTNGNAKQVDSTETMFIFEYVADISVGTANNGLFVYGTTGGDAKAASGVTIKLTSYTDILNVNDVIVLRGAGTTGLLRDSNDKILNWDTDIVAKVTAEEIGVYRTYTLVVQKRESTGYTDVSIKKAENVFNVAGGNISPAFTVFKQFDTTARYPANFVLSPTTATVTLSTLTLAGYTPQANEYINIDGLAVHNLTGLDMNGSFKVISTSGATFLELVVEAHALPATLRDTVTYEPSTVANGKVLCASRTLKQTVDVDVNVLEVDVTGLTTAIAMAQGDWVFMICRGSEQRDYSLQVSGWFQIHKLYVGASWVTSAAAGATVEKIGVVFNDTLDYSAITGLSALKVIVAGSSGNVKYIPVPVPTKQNILSDATGEMFGPKDGFTPLEKIIKRLATAINTVLHDTHFAYWGKFNSDQSDQNQHPPVNGLRIHSHLYPDDKYRYHYSDSKIVSAVNESQWSAASTGTMWKVEGETRFTVTTAEQFTFSTKRYRPSRCWWTNPTTAGFGQAFRELSVEEISSQDGEQVLGVAPFQSYAIFAKKSSLWRGGFSGGTTLSIQKIPSTVGASSAKNMVPTERGVFILHDSGLYITDGGSVEPILQVSRYFNSRVVQNVGLFSQTAGHHNPLTKTVYLGIPLSDTELETTTEVSSQFVFNYSLKNVTLNTIDAGWSVNTNFPATAWVRVQADDYFASTKGKIYRLRTERAASKYNDETVGAHFKVTTRFIDSQDPIDFKFYRSIFFQFGKETSATFVVSMGWDFSKDYTQISTYQLDKEGFGEAPFGTSYFGCDRYIETLRRTPIRNRLAQISLRVEDSAIDSAAELYGVFLESSQVTTKLHKQGN